MKQTNKTALCKRKPKEQIVSAHAQDPAESPASGHMLKREGTINPSVTRN